MARKKEFDPEKAIHEAMQVFWLQGYDATSIDDLCKAMDIRRGSLYDTFTDKRTLYMKALEHYLDINYPQDINVADGQSPMQFVRMLFQYAVDEAVNDTQQRGCLMINTITELSTSDAEIANICSANGDRLHGTFTELLRAAQQQGEISEHHDIQSKAQFLVSTMYGIRITGKLTRDRGVLENVMNETLSTLQ